MTRFGLCAVSTALTISLLVSLPSASACPFCSAQSQTFSEEIRTMDAVVVARLVKRPAASKPLDAPGPGSSQSSQPDFEIAKATFEIIDVLKGKSLVTDEKTIETLYFGDGVVGEQFLVMGVDPPKLMWSTPMKLTTRGRTYLTKLLTIPDKGVERLRFFQGFLEDEDEMLARDAYDEFANTPYDEVKQLRPYMNHDQLVKWIQSKDVPASRRRLYLTMLGVCGDSKDLPMLESMMRSSDRKMKAGLDAMIACYLTLAGESGMPLIEELFLKNASAEYSDTYSAIMALRFHGTEGQVISRGRIVQGLRHMLDRPKLADLVIPDLARWKDWTVMPKLVELFKNADDKSSWVRVPVINYLRACPLPEAKEYISELEKVDPAAVKRANTFFPFSPAGTSSSSWQRPAEKTKPQVVSHEADSQPAAAAVLVNADVAAAIPAVDAQPAIAGSPPAGADETQESGDTGQGLAEVSAAAPLSGSGDGLHPLLLFATPLLFAAALFLLMWSILRGLGDTSSQSSV